MATTSLQAEVVEMAATATLPSSQQSERSFRYTNPLTRDASQSMRDHMFLEVGDGWHLTGTSHSVWGGQNSGLRLMELEDFLILEDAGLWIDDSKLPKDCPCIGRFRAPELHHIQGEFYLFINDGHEGPKAVISRLDNHRVWIFESEKIVDPYPNLIYEDTKYSYVEIGHNGVFVGPDGKNWICYHYWLQAEAAIKKEFSELIHFYEWTQEQLVIEPLLYEDGRCVSTGRRGSRKS
jgi:hypothetical protein